MINAVFLRGQAAKLSIFLLESSFKRLHLIGQFRDFTHVVDKGRTAELILHISRLKNQSHTENVEQHLCQFNLNELYYFFS